MRIALRADASSAIGFGHVSRCLALAESLIGAGNQVALVGGELPAAMRRRADEVGVSHLPIAAVGQLADATACIEAIGRWGGADVCLVDSYALGAEWERALREAGPVVVAIDDLGRKHDCALLIDANVGASAERYRDRMTPQTLLLLGPRYAMLRPALDRLHASARTRKEVARIVVAYGGTDPTAETPKAIDALASLTDISVDVVVTSAHAQLALLRGAAAAAPHFRMHVDSHDLDQLLGEADLALGAAGVSALERACIGLPSLLTVVADNQSASAAALANEGAALLLGAAGSVSAARLRQAVQGVRACPDLLQRMSARGLALVDGRGATRVAAALASLRLVLRHATLDDARSLFAWRDDPRTRAYALDSRPLDWDAHRQWLSDRLADPQCELLIGFDDRGPVGVLRFDVNGDSAAVSIYLVPERHGAGLGAPLLRAGERWLQDGRPGVSDLRATILEDNRASLRAFAEAGFQGCRRELRRILVPVDHANGGSA